MGTGYNYIHNFISLFIFIWKSKNNLNLNVSQYIIIVHISSVYPNTYFIKYFSKRMFYLLIYIPPKGLLTKKEENKIF